MSDHGAASPRHREGHDGEISNPDAASWLFGCRGCSATMCTGVGRGPLVTVFLVALGGSFAALAQVLVVVVGAGVLVRFAVISEQDISTLSKLSVMVFLPCLIFSNVIANLDPGAMAGWWILPLVAVAMPAVGLLLGMLAFAGRLGRSRHLLALCSMQNAGFLVLPVGLALYPERFDTFALYCFLFILGFNPVLWSVGKALATDGADGLDWRGLFTPPLVANVVAVAIALAGVGELLPQVAVDAVTLVGKGAVPVATVVLGAVLAKAGHGLGPYVSDGLRVAAVKLILLPAATIMVLWLLGLDDGDPMLAQFLVVEAAAAPAVGLILQVRSYGGNEEAVGAVMLMCYGACAVTMPVWLAVWAVVRG